MDKIVENDKIFQLQSDKFRYSLAMMVFETFLIEKKNYTRFCYMYELLKACR